VRGETTFLRERKMSESYNIKDTSSFSKHDPYPEEMVEHSYDDEFTKAEKEKKRRNWDRKGKDFEDLPLNFEIDRPVMKIQNP
jgi:hypothetical protein